VDENTLEELQADDKQKVGIEIGLTLKPMENDWVPKADPLNDNKVGKNNNGVDDAVPSGMYDLKYIKSSFFDGKECYDVEGFFEYVNQYLMVIEKPALEYHWKRSTVD
jgi:hypothetical protein